MDFDRYRFGDFLLDARNRRLTRRGDSVAVNARYLDALILLVRERGALVSKDAFHDSVWRGVPVTDEALTQCIRTLRRQLGDDAARPKFIETVPKHGYRFIAAVEVDDATDETPAPRVSTECDDAAVRNETWSIGAYGSIGAGVAGAVGGLFYGFAATAQAGASALSALLVVTGVTMVVALIGGAGVAFGIAGVGAVAGRGSPWGIVGGAVGGLLVGAAVKLFGLDAFELLLGQSPGDITGATEGGVLGGAVGLAGWLARSISVRRAIAGAGICGAAAGVLIALMGGQMMGGSLDLLTRSIPGSRLRLDAIGDLFGEAGFGAVSRAVTGGIEGALFAACIVGAMMVAARGFRRARPSHAR